jgi:hypothetical protein
MCVSGVVCLMGEGQMCTMKRARSGRPSVITEDLKNRVDVHVRENERFTIDELHEVFPYVLRSVLYETVTVQLRYRKICARCVPRMLTDEHMQKCMGAALPFLECYHRKGRKGEEFLDHIVTGDVTWVLHYAPEGNWQSQKWHHVHSPTKKP